MKRMLFCLLLATIWISASAIEIDGVCYAYSESMLFTGKKDVYVVSRSDGMKYSGDIVIKDSIECQIRDERLEYVTRKLPVTIIYSNAFRDCPDLKSVTIPKTIKSIVEDAFLGTCTDINILDLESWTGITLGGWTIKTGQRDKYLPAFPQGFNLYLNGKEAKDLIIPASVKTVGEYQFYKCQNIISVDVNATKLLSYAFSQCPNLATVNVGGNVETIHGTAFIGDSLISTVTIEEGKLRSITGFVRCKNLKSVKLPGTLKGIGEEAFMHSGLEHIDLASIETIDRSAFVNTALTAVEIPASVKTIGPIAFKDCKSLTTLGFIGCYNIKVGTSAFGGCDNLSYLYTDNLDAWCGSMNFSGDSPTKVTKRLYVDGKATEHVVCPNVSRIEGNLSYCHDIRTISFPENVEEIRPYAFYGCPNLKTIYCYATTPPVFYSSTFGETTFRSLTVYVPRESLELYKSYYSWKDCAQILPMEEDPTGIAPISYTPSIEQQDGVIIIKNVLDGEAIRVYDTVGTLRASAQAENQTVVVDPRMRKGEIAVVRIGEQTVKIVVE